MFGNKTNSQNQWAVQVLTLDFLIDGYFDAERGLDKMNHFTVFSGAPTKVNSSLHLSSVRIQSTGSSIPPKSPNCWTVYEQTGLVALIPRDDLSTRYVAQQAKGAHYTIKADAYVGPYLIRGSRLTQDTDLERFYGRLLLQDVTIDCLTSGSRFTELQAPFVIVHTPFLQGIVYHEDTNER